MRKHQNTHELVELWIPARRATRPKEKRGECFAPLYSINFDAVKGPKLSKEILVDSRTAQQSGILDFMKS